MPRPNGVAHRYVVEQGGVIGASNSAGSTQDSVSLSLELSVTVASNGSVRGELGRASISAGVISRLSVPDAAFPMPFAAPALVQGGQVALPARADPPCPAATAALLAPLRDVILRLPDTLRLGAAWSDSGGYETCRDGAPLRVSSRRKFVVTGAETLDGTPVLLVSRSAEIVVAGMVSRGADTTRVEGSGTATMNYEIDAESGFVRTAAGSGALDIAVRGRLKVERARQELQSRIRLRPD